MGYSTQQGWTSGYKPNSSSSSNKSSSNKSTTSTTQNRYAATSGLSSKNTVAVPSSSASYSTKSTGGSSGSSSNKSSSSSSSSNKSTGSTSSTTQNRAVATGSTSTARSTSSSSSSKSNSSSAKSTTSAAKTTTAAKTTSPTQNRAAATTTKTSNSSNTTKKATVASPTLSRYYATKRDNNNSNTASTLNNALNSVIGSSSLKPLAYYSNNNPNETTVKIVGNTNSYPADAYARRITNQNQVSNPRTSSTTHTSQSGNVHGGGGGNRTFGTNTTRPTIVINDESRSATPSNVPETDVKILSYPLDAYARRTTNQNQVANPLSTSNANINPQEYNSLPWNKAGNAAPGSEVIIPSKDNFGIPQNVLAAAAEAATNGTGRAKIQGNYTPTVTNTGNKVTNPSVPNNTIAGDDLIYGDDGTNADLEEYLNGDGEITLDDVMALIEQYGPSGAYNSYPWMKSELQNYLNNAISTLNTQGTNFQNRLNDSFSNLLLNQQLSNMKNNASGFTSGEMSGAVLANNILGNQSLANSMNEASKEYWADLISQANTLAQQEANIPTDALSALNNTYTDNIANMLAEYLTGYNYGNVASKVNGIYNNWDSKRNYDVNLRALNKKS